MRKMTAIDAQNSLYELIYQVNQDDEVIEVQHKTGNVMIMSREHYEGLQESLYLLSQKGFKSDFDQSVREADQGQTDSFEQVFGKS